VVADTNSIAVQQKIFGAQIALLNPESTAAHEMLRRVQEIDGSGNLLHVVQQFGQRDGFILAATIVQTVLQRSSNELAGDYKPRRRWSLR
jgi:hypothetical protein